VNLDTTVQCELEQLPDMTAELETMGRGSLMRKIMQLHAENDLLRQQLSEVTK
jgi:hypothetical protein